MTGVHEPDAAVADRVRAWLDVGGSWAAIATAHGATDVASFEREWAPRIVAARSANRSPRQRAAEQLTLFALMDVGGG